MSSDDRFIKLSPNLYFSSFLYSLSAELYSDFSYLNEYTSNACAELILLAFLNSLAENMFFFFTKQDQFEIRK